MTLIWFLHSSRVAKWLHSKRMRSHQLVLSLIYCLILLVPSRRARLGRVARTATRPTTTQKNPFPPATFKLYVTRVECFTSDAKISGDGAIVKRSVPDDNSCLFHSLVYGICNLIFIFVICLISRYCFEHGKSGKIDDLRDIIADTVQKDTINYNQVRAICNVGSISYWRCRQHCNVLLPNMRNTSNKPIHGEVRF